MKIKLTLTSLLLAVSAFALPPMIQLTWTKAGADTNNDGYYTIVTLSMHAKSDNDVQDFRYLPAGSTNLLVNPARLPGNPCFSKAAFQHSSAEPRVYSVPCYINTNLLFAPNAQ